MALGDIPVHPLRPYENWGGENWRAEWRGEDNLLKALGVMKVSIQTAMEIAVADAKANHPLYPPASEPLHRFATRTDQTVEAIDILDDAHIDWGPEPIHVWGRWGVRDWEAFRDVDIFEGAVVIGAKRGAPQDVTIENRGMFLEFGTARMLPRPFLYPAWDLSKAMLPGIVMANRYLMGGAVDVVPGAS